MFILNKGCRTAQTVDQMYQYMLNEGFGFSDYELEDSSPYAILNGGTSIGYRKRSKWNQKGIVFFCATDGIDKDNLVKELNLEVFDNSSDSARIYAVFVPEKDFEKAVQVLKKNEKNLM